MHVQVLEAEFFFGGGLCVLARIFEIVTKFRVKHDRLAQCHSNLEGGRGGGLGRPRGARNIFRHATRADSALRP